MEIRLIALCILAVFWSAFLAIAIISLPAWLRALRGRAPVPMIKVISLRVFGADAPAIIGAYVGAKKQGAAVTVDQVAMLWKAAPRTFQTDVDALVAAQISDEKRKEPKPPATTSVRYPPSDR